VTTTRVPGHVQAERMLAALEIKEPGLAGRLCLDPLAVLQARDDLRVEFVGETGMDGGCSIAGHYREEPVPPTLVVARSLSYRRRQYTGLHEFGHHVQRQDIRLLASLARSPEGRRIEESASDHFAARILIPESMVSEHVGDRGPSAQSVIDLFHRSQASRAACCVRAAERMTSPGAVFLLDEDGKVNFTIGHGMPPPARGSDQSATPLVKVALESGRGQRTTHLLYSTGGRSDDLYGDIAPIDGMFVAVVVTDRAPWKPFAPARPGTGRAGTSKLWTCEYCGEVLETFGAESCRVCRQPRCPDDHCSCTGRKEKYCPGCNLWLHRAQFRPNSDKCMSCE
jgi:hypothetical protein